MSSKNRMLSSESSPVKKTEQEEAALAMGRFKSLGIELEQLDNRRQSIYEELEESRKNLNRWVLSIPLRCVLIGDEFVYISEDGIRVVNIKDIKVESVNEVPSGR